MKYHLLILSALFVLVSFGSGTVMASNLWNIWSTQEEGLFFQELEKKDTNSRIKDQLNGKDFYFGNFETMSKLFWAFDIPDVNSEEHKTAFIQINECEVYEAYKGNEFEWKPIMQSMHKYLDENADLLPKEIYFDLPIEVGDYVLNKNHFPVISSQFTSAERLFLPHGSRMGWKLSKCGLENDELLDAYPREIAFRLIRPIIIPNINVPEDVAESFVAYWKETEVEQRFLKIRLYFKVTKFSGFETIGRFEHIALFVASIQGYKVFSPFDDIPVATKSYLRARQR